MVNLKKLKKKERKEIKKIEEQITLDPKEELKREKQIHLEDAEKKHPMDEPVVNESNDIDQIMQRINLREVFEEMKKEDMEPTPGEKPETTEILGKKHRANLIKWAEKNYKRGDKESLLQAIEHYEEILAYEKSDKEIIQKIDKIYREILHLPDGKNDLNNWELYAEFCQKHHELKRAVKIFRGISTDLRNKLEEMIRTSRIKKYLLTFTVDVKSHVITVDFKGEGHCTNTYHLDPDLEKQLEWLKKDARRITAGNTSEWKRDLIDVGKRVYDNIFLHKDWKWMLLECYKNKGIIEFKIDEQYIEFPIELLFYQDFTALTTPMRKHLLNIGEHIQRKPLTIEYYTGEPLKALLAAPGVGGLTEVNEEIKTITGLLLNEQNLFHFEKITCLTDDPTVKEIDPRIKQMEPTAVNFRKELENGHYHLLHYAGHGLFQDRNPDMASGLLFKNDMGNQYMMNLMELESTLRNSSLNFVYFNCCKSGHQASNDRDNIFLGKIRTSLIAGVPAVIAMRWAIYDHSAKLIAREFYKSFIKNGCPEIALQKAKRYARQELIKFKEHDISWAAPMLIMH